MCPEVHNILLMCSDVPSFLYTNRVFLWSIQKGVAPIVKPVAHMATFSFATFAEQPENSQKNCRAKEVGGNRGEPRKFEKIAKEKLLSHRTCCNYFRVFFF